MAYNNAIKALYSESLTGGNNIGAAISPALQNLLTSLFGQSLKLPFVFTPDEERRFEDFANGILSVCTKNTKIGHPVLRAAQLFLQTLLWQELKKYSSAVYLDCTFREALNIVRETYLTPFQCRFLITKGHAFDNQRLQHSLTLAHLTAATGNAVQVQLANDFINTVNTKVSTGPFDFVDVELEDFYVGNYDVVVFVDSIYYTTPLQLRRFMLRNKITSFLSIHHCARELKVVKEFKNDIFDTIWQKTGTVASMSFKEGSKPYVQKLKNVLAWSKSSESSFLSSLSWEALYFRHGYGLFSGTIIQGFTIRLINTFHSINERMIRIFDFEKFYHEGKLVDVFVNADKYNQMVRFIATLKEPTPEKIIQYIRSNASKVMLGAKVISANWDFLEEDLFTIASFALLEASLSNCKIKDAFRDIAGILRRGRRIDWLMVRFVKRIKAFFAKVMKPQKFLELINDYKANTPKHVLRLRYGFKNKLASFSLPSVSVFNALYLFLTLAVNDGYGGPVAFKTLRDELYGTKFVHSICDTHSAEKLLSMEKPVGRWVAFGCEPLGFVNHLLDLGCYVVAMRLRNSEYSKSSTKKTSYIGPVVHEFFDKLETLDENVYLKHNPEYFYWDVASSSTHDNEQLSFFIKGMSHAVAVKQYKKAIVKCNVLLHPHFFDWLKYFEETTPFNYSCSVHRDETFHPLSYEVYLIFERRLTFRKPWPFNDLQRTKDEVYRNWKNFEAYYEDNISRVGVKVKYVKPDVLKPSVPDVENKLAEDYSLKPTLFYIRENSALKIRNRLAKSKSLLLNSEYRPRHSKAHKSEVFDWQYVTKRNSYDWQAEVEEESEEKEESSDEEDDSSSSSGSCQVKPGKEEMDSDDEDDGFDAAAGQYQAIVTNPLMITASKMPDSSSSSDSDSKSSGSKSKKSPMLNTARFARDAEKKKVRYDFEVPQGKAPEVDVKKITTKKYNGKTLVTAKATTEKEVFPDHGLLGNVRSRNSDWVSGDVYGTFGEKIKTELKTKGLYPLDVQADGWCVWRSLATLIFQNQSLFLKVKKDVERKSHSKFAQLPSYDEINKILGIANKIFKGRMTGKIILGNRWKAGTKTKAWGILYTTTDYWVEGKQCKHAFVTIPDENHRELFSLDCIYRSPTEVPVDVKFNRIGIEVLSEHSPLEHLKDAQAYFENIAGDFEAHKPSIEAVKSLQQTRKDFEYCVIRGAAGCGKSSWAVRFLIKNCDTTLYITPLNENRREIESKVKAHFRNPMQRMYVRTSIVALAQGKKSKQGMVEMPRTGIEYVVIDEAYRHSVHHFHVFVEAFPNAKFILLGDPGQMTFHEEWASHSMGQVALTSIKEFLTPTYNLNSSFRFGPQTAAFLRNRLNVDIFSATNKELTLVHLDGNKDDVVRNETSTIEMVFAHSDKLTMSRDRTLVTVSASQGASKECSVLHLFKEPNFSNSAVWYVALSRHSRLLTIMDYADVGRKLVAHLSCDFSKSGYGGSYWRERTEDKWAEIGLDESFMAENAQFNPTVIVPTKVEYTKFKQAEDPFGDEFCLPLLFENADHNLGIDNMMEASYHSAEPNSVRIRVQLESLKFKEAFQRTLNLGYKAGKVHMVSSSLQALNTFLTRSAKASENQKYQQLMLARYGSAYWLERLPKRFMDMYIDQEKFEAIGKEFIDDALAKAYNDFCDVAKIEERHAHMTLNSFLGVMRGHLKQQIKAKGWDAAYKNKAGQPITACPKAYNILFSTLFRTMRQVVVSSLKSNILLADGVDDRGVHDFVKKFDMRHNFMGDMPNFDACKGFISRHFECYLWYMFCPDYELLMMFENLVINGNIYADEFVILCPGVVMRREDVLSGNYPVDFSPAARAWQSSGDPATMLSNIFTMMFIMCMTFKKITYGVFKGDDSGSGHETEVVELNLDFYRMFFSEPMKIIMKEDVLEFCNHLFTNDAYCYNPSVLYQKIMNKNYVDVLATKEKWQEYQDAYKVTSNPYREFGHAAAKATAMWHDISLARAESMIRPLIAFSKVTYDQMKEAAYHTPLFSDETSRV